MVSTIHKDLDMQKLSAKWAAKCVNADQKCQRSQPSEKIWNFSGAIQIISCQARLVTMDETWLYHYDPERKQLSMEWRHSVSPCPKKFRVKKSAGKVLACLDFFGNKMASSSLIIFQRADILKEKRRARKGHRGGFFLHNNAPAHRALPTQ